jgi:hypothetical protein
VSDAPRPPLTTTTSILPAMIVVGVAVATLAIFLTINLVANPRVTTTHTTLPIIVGGLAQDPANHALSGCQQAGNPPSDIATALMLPVDTVATGATRHRNAGAGEYDCERAFSSATSSARLLGFYRAHLEARGWHLFSRVSGGGQPQLLFQRAGSDTFYWVVGVTVTQHRPSTTRWTFRIYQNSAAI